MFQIFGVIIWLRLCDAWELRFAIHNSSLVIYPFVREPCKTDDMQAGILTPVTQTKHRSTQRLIMTWENNGAPDRRQSSLSFFPSFMSVSPQNRLECIVWLGVELVRELRPKCLGIGPFEGADISCIGGWGLGFRVRCMTCAQTACNLYERALSV